MKEVVGRMVECPKCEGKGCRYCHKHGLVIQLYKSPVFVPDKGDKVIQRRKKVKK